MGGSFYGSLGEFLCVPDSQFVRDEFRKYRVGSGLRSAFFSHFSLLRETPLLRASAFKSGLGVFNAEERRIAEWGDHFKAASASFSASRIPTIQLDLVIQRAKDVSYGFLFRLVSKGMPSSSKSAAPT